MIPLGGNAFPRSREELLAALSSGLTNLVQTPDIRQAIAVIGAFPNLDSLTLNLTGAAIKDTYRPAPVSGTRQPGFTAANFLLAGKPVLYQGTPFIFELSAT